MLKKFRPNTPGQRHLTLLKHECLTRISKSGGTARAVVAPEKSLLCPKKSTGGRNNRGKITCRHRGGGHKRHYRQIDFRRVKEKIPALVHSIEYDPGRSAYVALLFYADGEKQYIIAPQGLKVGARVVTDDEGPFDIGCAMRLKHMPVGSTIHNIEIYPGRGAQLVRSAGLSAQLMARSGGYATIKMPSKEIRLINEQCKATFGAVSNPEHSLRSEGKAGRMRWKGVRPTVRGNAMNPVDHPHGGAEGKNKGNTPQSPWGVYAKGFRTRKKSKSTKMIVKDRRKK